MTKALLNGIAFNISWLAIVYSQSIVVALSVTVAHLGLHAMLLCKGRREWLLIAGITLSGLLLDQVLFACGLFTVNGQYALAPLWFSCLWPVLATTLGHAFAALQTRPLLASLAGAAGGTMSYLAGTAITQVDFASPVYGPVIIGLLWSLLMPALTRVAALALNPEQASRAVA